MTYASLIEKLEALKVSPQKIAQLEGLGGVIPLTSNAAVDSCIAIVLQHHPVPVSLEICASALAERYSKKTGGSTTGSEWMTTMGACFCDEAKTVLEAAGVAYAE